MKKLSILIGLMLVVASGCDKVNSPCHEDDKTAALITDFPDSLAINEKYDLAVKFVLENSCGEFDSFDVAENGNTSDITVKTHYEGCNCDLELIERTNTYTIQKGAPGVYQFRFWVAENDWDTYSLTVYQ